MIKYLLNKHVSVLLIALTSMTLLGQNSFTFETAGDAEGWGNNYETTDFTQKTESGNGVISFNGAGGNATIKRFGATTGVDSGANPYLKLVVKNASNATSFRIGYYKNGTTDWAWLAWNISSGDTSYKTYKVDVSQAPWGDNAQWAGEEKKDLQLQFRIDGTTAVSGAIHIDEISFAGPSDDGGIIQNPSIDDLEGSMSPFTAEGKAYWTVEPTTEEAKNGIQSIKTSFSAPNVNGDGVYEKIDYYNGYHPSVGPFAAGDNPEIKVQMYVKYKNDEVGAPTEKSVTIRAMLTLKTGGTAHTYRGATVTNTLQNGGDWQLFEFAYTETTAAFDAIFFRPAIWHDVENSSQFENGDVLYFDEMSSCINCATLSAEAITDAVQNVTIYPNPTDGLLHITDVTDMQSINILNLLGQNVKTLKAANTIDVSDLNKGIYFLSTDRGLTRKFIKE